MSTAACLPSQPHVAIIGGGMAGLSASSRLSRLGITCTVFDMGSRNLGGRAASRILQKEGLSFDHGCQFFAPVSAEFSSEVERWAAHGAAAPWQGSLGSLHHSTLMFSPFNDSIQNFSLQHDSIQCDGIESGRLPDQTSFCNISLAGRTSRTGTSRTGNAAVSAGMPYVGTPSTSAVGDFLAKELQQATNGKSSVYQGHKVTSISWNDSTRQWNLAGTISRTPSSITSSTPSRTLQKKEGNEEMLSSSESSGQFSSQFSAVIMADALAAIPDSAGFIQIIQNNLPATITDITTRISRIQHDPVFSLMVAFENPVGVAVPFDAAWIQQPPSCSSAGATGAIEKGAEGGEAEAGVAPFQWIARDSSKPGRPGNTSSSIHTMSNATRSNDGSSAQECWVAITTAGKARDIMKRWPLHSPAGEYNPQTQTYREGVSKELVGDFLKVLGTVAAGTNSTAAAAAATLEGTREFPGTNKGFPRVTYQHAQRWGRGFVSEPLPVDYLGCEEGMFAACGDFCGGSSGEFLPRHGGVAPVESAWLSGQRAAEVVAGWLLESQIKT